VSIGTVIALALAVASTTLTSLAYLREHDAAAALPVLSMRRPVHSLMLLLDDRSWLRGFAMETSGFLLYAAALSLASLALVQSIAAGGIGVLAYVSARVSGRRLGRRELSGVLLSVLGLLVLWLGRRTGAVAVADGFAGGLLFSIGDISTKLATQGGARIAFVGTLILGYALGSSLLQLGYQRSGALTVAGIATLLTDALPIAAGTLVLGEGVPAGVLGGVRVLAFVAVTGGAILLAAPDHRAAK